MSSQAITKFIVDRSPDTIRDENNILKISKKIFEQHRMMILFNLLQHKVSSFQDLKNTINTTDGNLASHLRALEINGFIKSKTEINKKISSHPITFYTLTKHGREELSKLIKTLKQHLDYLVEI